MSVHAHLGVFQTAERLFSLQERLEYFLLVWDGNVRTDRVEILQEEMTRLGDDILDLAQTLNWENFRVHAAAMANALRACRIAVQSFFSGSRVPDGGSTASDFADVDVLPEWTSSDRRRHFEAARLTVTQLLGSVIQLTPGLKLSLPPHLQPFFEICRLTFPAQTQIDEISGLSTDERHHRLLNEVRPGLIRELGLCASIQPGLVNIRIGPLVLQRSEGDLHDFRRHMESCLTELCTETPQPHERAVPLPQMRSPVSEQQSEASTACGILRHGGEPALLVTATQTVSDMSRCLSAHEGTDSAETAGVTATLLPNGGTYVIITDQAPARINEPTTISAMTNAANSNERPESAGDVERLVADPIVNPAPNAVDQLPTDGGENNGCPSGNEPLVLSGAAGRDIEDARVLETTGERSGAEAETFPYGNVAPELVRATDGLIADPIVNPAPNAVHQQPVDGRENNGSPSSDEPSVRARAADEETQDAGVPITTGERSGAEVEAFPNGDVPPELVSATDGHIADPAVNAGGHLQPESAKPLGAKAADSSTAAREKLRDGFAPSDVGLTLTGTQSVVFTILFHRTEPLTIVDLVKETNKVREPKKKNNGPSGAFTEGGGSMRQHLGAIKKALNSKFPQYEDRLLNNAEEKGKPGKYSLDWHLFKEALRSVQT